MIQGVVEDWKSTISMTVPYDISAIGPNAFNGCNNIKTIEFKDDALKIVGKNAFSGCNSLIEFNGTRHGDCILSIGD